MKTFIHAVGGAVIEGASTSEALRSLEFKNSLEAVVAPQRYLVSWGAGRERECPTFVDALALYIDHQADRFGVQIHNLDRMVDGGDSGLTDDERAAVELADEMFSSELAS